MKNQFIVKSLKFALGMMFFLFLLSCSEEVDTLNIDEQSNVELSSEEVLAKGGNLKA